MGCEVNFRDDTSGRIQTVTVVYPGEADMSQVKTSALTPIGTALIGFRAGQVPRLQAEAWALASERPICQNELLYHGKR